MTDDEKPEYEKPKYENPEYESPEHEKPEYEKPEATILSVALVDTWALSQDLANTEYDAIIEDFQKGCQTLVEDAFKQDEFLRSPRLHREASVQGGEFNLIMAPFTSQDPGGGDGPSPALATAALQLAVKLKRQWLCIPDNTRRLAQGRPLLDLAIGIHRGEVVLRNRPRFPPGLLGNTDVRTVARAVEGHALNLCQRVRSAARFGRISRIFVTRAIYTAIGHDFRGAFARVDPPVTEGKDIGETVYEAQGVGHFDNEHFSAKAYTDDLETQSEVYERVVKRQPNQLWLLLDLAHHYFDKGEFDKAEEKYRAVLEFEPEFAPAWIYLGRSRFRDHRLEEAKVALEKGVQLSTENARANNFLAVCLRRLAIIRAREQARLDEALALLDRSVDLHERAETLTQFKDYPWVRNGLLWTKGQRLHIRFKNHPSSRRQLCEEMVGLRQEAESFEKEFSELQDAFKPKEHLVFHTLGFLALIHSDMLEELAKASPLHARQLRADSEESKREAKRLFEKALEGLRQRAQNNIDKKSRGEREAEIHWHLGVCGERDGFTRATRAIIAPWSQDHQNRVLHAQYWYGKETL
jgi:tetratricopeptide (TPR) repeat protein